MQQLVGQSCKLCGGRIGSILEGRYCRDCRSPVHNACAQGSPKQPGEGRCPACGSDAPPAPETPQEARERRMWDVVPAAEIRRQARERPGKGGPYPVSLVCPGCGSAEYRKVRPERWIAFAWDRVCKGCGTRYTPPTPRWAGVVFLLAGLLLASFGALSVLMWAARANLSVPPVWDGLLGVVGVLAIIHGVRSLMKPGRV
jgi:hypothetical protein